MNNYAFKVNTHDIKIVERLDPWNLAFVRKVSCRAFASWARCKYAS